MSERLIETLSGGCHIRLRASMYLDAEPTTALRLALREIWVNAADEITFRRRPGIISIGINKATRTLSVSDNGEGIPEDKIVAAFLTVNTGSNFQNREANLAGANGIGVKAVSHTSKSMEVISHNNGKETILSIADNGEEGVLKSIKTSKASPKSKSKTGLFVSFVPLEKTYGDCWIDEKALFEEIDEAAKFYPNITFNISGDSIRRTINYPNGLKLPNTEAYYESENFILSLSTEPGFIKPYANRLNMPDGGAFFSHFKTQLTRTINETISFKISGSELQSALSGYAAIFVSNPIFSNQQKSAVSNKEVNGEITKAVKGAVEQLQKSSNWQKFIKNLETEVKAEEAAERARAKIKNARDEISKGSKKKVLCSDKLKDCINHGENAWLAITEGNSAQGSLNLGRDIESVATFPIRGKLINCLKNLPEKFLDNEEIKQICQILGCDIFDKYNSRKLKYGKVLICVDSDEDGKNIANLLMTFFYVCMPKFIQEGRLYWMLAPLYYNKSGTYIFNEEQWSQVKNRKDFTRAKGLGELDPKAVEEALFGKEKNWMQLVPKDWKKFSELIESLMGREVSERREFIFDNTNFEKVKFL